LDRWCRNSRRISGTSANIQRLMKYGKGLTREVQVIHFHLRRRDPAN